MKLLYKILCTIETLITGTIGTLAFMVLAGETIGETTFEIILFKVFAMFTLIAIYELEIKE